MSIDPRAVEGAMVEVTVRARVDAEGDFSLGGFRWISRGEPAILDVVLAVPRLPDAVVLAEVGDHDGTPPVVLHRLDHGDDRPWGRICSAPKGMWWYADRVREEILGGQEGYLVHGPDPKAVYRWMSTEGLCRDDHIVRVLEILYPGVEVSE